MSTQSVVPLLPGAAVAGQNPQLISILAFAEEHAVRPLMPGTREPPPAPAADLYDAYTAWCEARGETPLPLLGRASFGAALSTIPWITRTRPSAGITYHGIAVQSRAERARWAVLYGAGPVDNDSLWWQETKPRRAAAMQAHADRAHGGSLARCFHDLPASETARIQAEVAVALDARVASGEADRLAQERYLSWVPKPDPWLDRVLGDLAALPDDAPPTSDVPFGW